MSVFDIVAFITYGVCVYIILWAIFITIRSIMDDFNR